MAKTFRVGIDLSPASRLHDSPGTANHVYDQVRALMALDVPWEWVPVTDTQTNPLREIAARWKPTLLPVRGHAMRTTFALNGAWQRRGCQLGFATAFFVPWSGIPVVTNFFDAGLFDAEYARSWKSSGRGWNFRLIHTLSLYSLWRSRRLFIDSEYWSNVLTHKFPRIAPKIEVVPCGIRPPRPPIDVTPTWATLFPKPYVLFVGSFSDNKNQFRLLELWRQEQKQHADFPALVLIGNHDPHYFQKRIAPLLTTMPRPQEIIIPGVVSDDELAWAYQHAHFYIQPSFMEGFGMPIIEAMSYGLPVACSHTTSLPETAGGASMLFDPADINSLRDAVFSLWKDGPLRDRLSSQGRERSSHFTWENHASKIAAAIDFELTRCV